MSWLPSPEAVSRETIAVVLGAIAGAIIINQMPKLKTWLAANYAGPTPGAQAAATVTTTAAAQATNSAASINADIADAFAAVGWRLGS